MHARRIIETIAPADPAPFDRWPEATAAAPPRARAALTATVAALADAAGLERTADRAIAILAALADPLRARYPDAGARLGRPGAAFRRRGQPAFAA